MPSQRFVIHLLDWLFCKRQVIFLLFICLIDCFCLKAKAPSCWIDCLQKTSQLFVIHLFDWLFLLKGQGTIMLFIFWNWLFCSKAKSSICYWAASLFGMHPLVPQKPSLKIWPNWPENWNRIKLDLRETQKLKQNLLWHRLQNVKWEIQNILTKTVTPPLESDQRICNFMLLKSRIWTKKVNQLIA